MNVAMLIIIRTFIRSLLPNNDLNNVLGASHSLKDVLLGLIIHLIRFLRRNNGIDKVLVASY